MRYGGGHDGLGQSPDVSVGSDIAIIGIEGQLVQPLLVGRQFKVNPLLVFLALWFGGLFWGIAGIVLATPALVALKVVSEHAISGKALMEFLGPNKASPEQASRSKHSYKTSKAGPVNPNAVPNL